MDHSIYKLERMFCDLEGRVSSETTDHAVSAAHKEGHVQFLDECGLYGGNGSLAAHHVYSVAPGRDVHVVMDPYGRVFKISVITQL